MTEFERDVYTSYMRKIASVPGVLGAASGAVRGGLTGGLLGGVSGGLLNPLVQKIRGNPGKLWDDMKQGFRIGGKWGGITGAVRGGYEGYNNVDTIYKHMLADPSKYIENNDSLNGILALVGEAKYNPTGLRSLF